MRSDLAKLTTEKERGGSRYAIAKKYGGKVNIVHDIEHDYEDEKGGLHPSSRHRQDDGGKSLSDVLNPIRGALRKNVGRPWDKVYSEFCQFLDRRSISGIHIFGHLCGRGGEVTVSGLYVGEDGKVYEHQPPGFLSKRELKPVDGFYVHPITGLLCYKLPNYRSHDYHLRAKLNALRDNEVDIGEKKYRVINGCWFEVWTQVANKERWIPCWLKDDDAEKHNHGGHPCRRHHKTGEWGIWDYSQKYDMVVRQRSLNSKEIKMVKKYQLKRIEELEKELR